MSTTRALLRSARLFHTQRSTLPQTLIVFVTSRCNARCAFCLYKESVADPVRRSEEMTVDEYARVAAAYGPLHYLALSGGEPFVRQDIPEICQAFIDRCGTAVVDIPSNFFYEQAMLDGVTRLAAANPEVVVDLQLSIDHTGQRHDRSRVVDGLYERAMRSFGRLEEVREQLPNVHLKVNVVWLPSNQDDIEEIHAELGRRLGYDRISLTYPHCELPVTGAPEAVEDFARFRAAAERLAADPGRSGGDLYTLSMRATKRSYHRVIEQAISGDVAMGERCEAGRHIVVLDEKGEVFPCEVIWESVGNVREHGHDVGAVLAGDRYAAFRAARLGPGRCSCTWSCAALSAVSVTPRMLPRLALDVAHTAADELIGRGRAVGGRS